MMKTYAGYSAVKTGSGRHVYVRDESFTLFSEMLKKHRSNYHFTTIFRTVNLLNSDGHRGSGLNPAGDAKLIQSGNVLMRYNLHDGAVFVQTLKISKQCVAYSTGLYTVGYSSNEDEWLPKDNPIQNLSKAKKGQSEGDQACYVALPGSFPEIQAASGKMPQHFMGAYKKANVLTNGGAEAIKEYSLFWNNKGDHKSNESAQSLASIMQQSAKNKVPVNWLVHGEGVHTFSNAAAILKSVPSAEKAANQNVYFSNPASSTSENQLKKLCADAGLTYAGFNTNYRDLKRWRTLKNVGADMGIQALTLGATGTGGAYAIGSGVSGYSGLSDAYSSVVNGLTNSNYMLIGAGAVAVGASVVGLYKNVKVLGATVKCTFGRGNDIWYSGDDALYS